MCKRARPSEELGYAVLEAGVLQAYAPTTRWWLVADLIWHTPVADLIWEKSTTGCLRKAPLLVAIRIEWSSTSPLWNLHPCDPAPEEDGYTSFGKRSAHSSITARPSSKSSTTAKHRLWYRLLHSICKTFFVPSTSFVFPKTKAQYVYCYLVQFLIIFKILCVLF